MRSADDWARDAEDRPVWTLVKAAVIGTALVLVCVGIVGLATTGNVFFQGEAAKKTVGERTNVKVFSPENKIAQIAFFHDTCTTAQAQVRIVKNNQRRLAADEHAARFATGAIRQQQAQEQLATDEQDVTGAENALQATVAAYNSRSAQSTANVFKGTGLPERIRLPDPLTADYTIECG